GDVGGRNGVSWSIEINDYQVDALEYINELSKSESNYIGVSVTLSGLFFFIMSHDFFEKEFLYSCNFIYTIDNDFDITLFFDDCVFINNIEFFILKSDFLKIKNASKNGDEIAIDNYLYHQRKNSERSNKMVAPRISTPAKTAIKALISNHHPEIKGNPAKVAEVLAAEARQAGLGDVNFDKNTVSNWLKES
ncbi:hypothetical protein EWO26_22505, partial [Salmonella enterica]|nr:hypothetical protein [Salmonella enterica]